MKVFTWNCRGVLNLRTIDYIEGIMGRFKPDFICLVETKSNSDHIKRFCNRFNKNWDWAAIPSNGFLGVIIVLWKCLKGFVTLITISRLELHLIISSVTGTWILSTIYNSQVLFEHKTLEISHRFISFELALASYGGLQCYHF